MSTNFSSPNLSITARAAISSGTFPALSSVIQHNPTTALVAGTAVGNLNVVIQTALSITNGTPFTINVNTGTDPFGNTASMAHVCLVIIENDSTTTGQIFTVGGGTHAVLGSDSYTVQPNGGVVLINNPNPGYVVSSGSTDTVTITVAAGTSVAGKLTIMGRTT